MTLLPCWDDTRPEHTDVRHKNAPPESLLTRLRTDQTKTKYRHTKTLVCVFHVLQSKLTTTLLGLRVAFLSV